MKYLFEPFVNCGAKTVAAAEKNLALFKNPIFYIFLIPAFYWLYLLFSSRMIIQYDSIGYEGLGKMIYEQGWGQYFKTGPNREPFYPLLISLSMKISGLFSCPYYKIQTAAQLLIFALTQFLAFLIMRRCKIRTWIISVTLLYMGFSPAMVNSALSLYSEIAVYPFLLGIILFVAAAWQSLCAGIPGYKILPYATGFALCFIVSTLTKAAFELIFPIFLIPFLSLGLHFFLQKNFSAFKNSLVFLAAALIIFYSAISGYKWLNKTYNGQFVITDRGAWALYGNTDRRMATLTWKRFFVALTYVPGEGVCRRLFSQEECSFWSFRESDARGFAKLNEFNQKGTDGNEMNKQLIKLSLQKIGQNPAQYFLFMGLEGLKMFFWESTQIGFVAYPDWLQRLFEFNLFKDGLRLAIFLLTFAAAIYSMTFFWRNQRTLAEVSSEDHQYISTLFFIFFLIFVYIGLHSFFFTLTRYSLPIAPLYLITIAFAAEHIIPASKALKRT